MKKRLMKRFALSEAGAKGLIQATVWSVLCNIALMVPVFLIMWVISRMIPLIESGRSVIGILPMSMIAAAVVLLLLWVLHYFQYAALYITVFSEGANRRIALAERLRRLPLSYFGRKDTSDLTTTLIADEAVLEQMFSHFVPIAFAVSISIVLIGAMLLAANWKMGLAILWVVPIALALTFGSKKLQDKHGRVNIEYKRAVTDKIQEGIEHIQDIKAFGIAERYEGELRGKVKASIKKSLRSELVTGSFISSAQAFIHIGIATAVLTGVFLMQRGELNFLYFLGFMFAAARMYDPVEIVMEHIAATFATQLKVERMRAIQEERIQEGSADFAPKKFDIVFDHVNFAYQEGESVIEDVSFTAKQGEVTALIGPSGSGKSTVSKLAARFWDIDGGKITLGGLDIGKADPETLLGYYSIVFQDVVLFNDTVMENIRLGRKNATDAEVIEAAKAARCDEFVQNLPDGYGTRIGENGARLSGGERQRISIARAFLKNAPVILLDEATASLDVENESEVQKALGRLVKDRTVMIIAHRMRTIAQADHIIVLDKGRIVEEGRPEALLKKKHGFYAHMIDIQNRSAKWRLK
ncbi:MAG: ABC transporter ATP-binding protein [Sphaerochaetaceae bacterium]